MKRGFLSNAFAFVANAGIIGGIKASAAATVALNPFGLGAIASIAATAVVSGVAISGYKKWRHGHDWNTFGKNVLTHSAFGMVGGGLGFYGEDYIAPLVEKISGYFNWSAAPVPKDFQNFELQGQAIQSVQAEQSPMIINTEDTEVVLSPKQMEMFVGTACREMEDCVFSEVAADGTTPPLPEILSTDLSDNIVNITGMTYCDSGCAAGQASLLCPFPEDPLNAPVRIAFDMDQARTITQSYCDQTANCYFEEAPIIVEEDPEIIAATDMASQRVAQAHELTSGTPDPDLDEALPEAAAVNDPVVDDGDYELPPLATLPPVAGDEVTDLYVPPDEISERVAQAHALASGTPDMDATVPETVTTSDLVIDYEDYELPPLAMLPPIGVTDAFDSILTDIPDDTNPLTGAFNDNNMDLEIVTGNPLHIVEVGDNLWDIAEQEYGDGEMYRVIVQANLEKYPELLEHPDLIQPDMELVIPPADAPAADCVTGNVQSHRPTICAPAMQLAA